MPERIQRRRTKGWRMPGGAVYVGRPTKWGNPFIVGKSLTPGRLGDNPSVVITQEIAVAAYRSHVDQFRHEFGAYTFGDAEHDLNELAGRDLVCWCPLDQPCHADVLLEIANTPAPDPTTGEPRPTAQKGTQG